MRPLPLLALLFAAFVSPAHAIVRGAVARDPNGIRQSVVRVESARGELCSGAIIAPDIVLTAAHCISPGAAYRVVGVDRRFRSLVTPVVGIAVHPSFVPGTTPKTQPGIDLALLKLARPFGNDFTPLDPRNAATIASGTQVTIAGFGIVAESRKAKFGILRQAPLVALGSLQVANEVLLLADLERFAIISGAGACRGDSGGPVIAQTEAGPQLLGVVSWSQSAFASRSSSACGGTTAITPLAEHRRWIRQAASAFGG